MAGVERFILAALKYGIYWSLGKTRNLPLVLKEWWHVSDGTEEKVFVTLARRVAEAFRAGQTPARSRASRAVTAENPSDVAVGSSGTRREALSELQLAPGVTSVQIGIPRGSRRPRVAPKRVERAED